MRLRILTTVSVGLLAAACQNTTNTSGISAATGSGLYASSNQACVDYGFVPNTAAYSRCVSSEQQARASYRATPGYAPSMISNDARNACYSYGLTVGSAPYDRCVAREVDAPATVRGRHQDARPSRLAPQSPADSRVLPSCRGRLQDHGQTRDLADSIRRANPRIVASERQAL